MVSFKTLQYFSEKGTKYIKEAHNFSFGNKSTKPIIHFGKVQPQYAKPSNTPINFGTPSQSLINKKYQTAFKSNAISGPEDIQNIERICNDFYRDTGIRLYSPARDNLDAFNDTLMRVHTLQQNGIFPANIKHLLIGHGTGSSLDNTWRIQENGTNIFDYIKRNIPQGDKVLVTCCEEGRSVTGKPEIGNHVCLTLTDPNKPGKIVESGKNEIIDAFLTNMDCNTLIRPQQFRILG